MEPSCQVAKFICARVLMLLMLPSRHAKHNRTMLALPVKITGKASNQK